MKKYLLAILMLATAWTGMSAGKVVTDSIQSDTLGECIHYNVYLPSGYDASGQTKYPVLYLLHGLYGTHQNWEQKGQMRLVADELMSSGECRKMVVIMPEAGHPDAKNHWNGYFNMEGRHYENFFFHELLPAAERKYNIIGDRHHRAVSGLSMGGGGSVVYCLHHPDMFGSCYAMSAWLDTKVDEAMRQKSPIFHALQTMVHRTAATPYISAASKEAIDSLKQIKWFIDCGDDDFLLDVNEDLRRVMKKRGIQLEYRVRNGVHNWEYWHNALRLALPFISRNME